MSSEDVFGDSAGTGGVGHAVLLGDDFQFREFFGDGLFKSLFAQNGRTAAGLLHDHGDVASSIQESSKSAGRGSAGFEIASGDEADVVFDLDTRIKDGDWDACFDGAFERSDEGGGVTSGDGDGRDLLGDHAIDDFNLAGKIGFVLWTVPEDIDFEVFRGLVYAGMDGHEEHVRGGFGDDADDFLAGAAAG